MTSLRGHGREKGERKEGAKGSWKKREVGGGYANGGREGRRMGRENIQR